MCVYQPTAVFLAFSDFTIAAQSPAAPQWYLTWGARVCRAAPGVSPEGTSGCHQVQVRTTALATISGAQYTGKPITAHPRPVN